MVFEVGSFLYTTTVFFSFLTAVLGLLLINSLFKNRLQDLFEDTSFFIFFCLVWGYALFAMGELVWYLILATFGEAPAVGMADFYWTLGSVLLVLAFGLLYWNFSREYLDAAQKRWLLWGGAILLGLVVLLLLPTVEEGRLFVSFFYPLASALVVIFSATIPLSYEKLGEIRFYLLLLFFANVALLVADLFYSLTLQKSGSAVLSDLFYTGGYFLSSLSFLTLLLHVHLTKKSVVLEG